MTDKLTLAVNHALNDARLARARMMMANPSNPNPLGRMLGDLRNMGYEVEAALFQLLSLQHHLESLRQKIGMIERAIR
ncbi:hypothetical protein ACI1AD_000893 [Cronobacter dublinensis]